MSNIIPFARQFEHHRDEETAKRDEAYRRFCRDAECRSRRKTAARLAVTVVVAAASVGAAFLIAS